MGIYLDSADIEELKSLNEYPFVEGVTCNPSIISKAVNKNKMAQSEFYFLITKLAKLSPGYIFIQVNFTKTQDIIAEAKKINALIPKSIIKIPFTKDGLKAIKKLKPLKIKTAATALFDARQAYIAAKCGADYVIPYCNRITRSGANGAQVCKNILELILKHNLKTRLLAASIKSISEAEELLLAGVPFLTVTFDLLEQLACHPLSRETEENFQKSLKIIS